MNPHFGLLASGGDLRAGHLRGQAFETNLAVLISASEGDGGERAVHDPRPDRPDRSAEEFLGGDEGE